ncbi:succinate dehydrogenase/fumarate reductase iron-sulfur subunit [Methanofollis aquaemaris]|uniref:Succinate dehydrogenase/fumarate reductase iron-sulfur subunit n=1 Tax=Methanofollis aquaemaris TaxID=126734 RepID=A0A8A3S7L8_9EURY|nr:fumarate reductase (CoM/CoB) subunit TfrB [Methanofollis aquaemaris]QSZ67596.1 succinate dehydrogenase/fumarate reductase iron-sulfur subunit [Methanofollis aquaemaris]
MKEITFRVSRFDPETDSQPHLEEYTVEVHDGARVLHALHAVHAMDPTLAYRWCCGAGQCGSCAVKVDGIPGLACLTEARDGMVVEPLDLPVTRDLEVELAPYLGRFTHIEPAESAEFPTQAEIEAIKPLRECIECMSCVSVCPALQVSDFAGPTAMRQELRLALDPRDTGNRAAEAVARGLFACTSCQQCRIVCPKEIQIPGKAIEKLREVAARQGLALPRHTTVAEMVRETGRSVDRTKPTLLEQVPAVIEPEGEVKATIGFFVGCMYNGRLPETALDMLAVMRRNGIRVIIPHEQVCCGSPLIRTGQTEFVDYLKRRNIEAFRTRDIDLVMTMCAGCGSTLKNDYKTPFRVMDATEVLAKYGCEAPAKLPLTVTYHDPCHLLRGQGISEEPRALLRTVVKEFVETPNQCCGSGGGVRSGRPEVAAALGEKRGEAFEASGAGMVVSCCPFCEYHISEHTNLPVKDLMTLLREGYEEKDRQRAGKKA